MADIISLCVCVVCASHVCCVYISPVVVDVQCTHCTEQGREREKETAHEMHTRHFRIYISGTENPIENKNKTGIKKEKKLSIKCAQ